MLSLHAGDHPALKEVITNLQQWDRKATAASKGAAVFLLTYDYVARKLAGTPGRELTKSESLETYQYIHDYMIQYFGTD